MPDCDTVSIKRPGTWPRRARLAVEAIVTVMTNAYMMARSRAAGSPSRAVSLMAERGDALWRAALAEPVDGAGPSVRLDRGAFGQAVDSRLALPMRISLMA